MEHVQVPGEVDRNEEHWEWNWVGGVDGKQIDGTVWEEGEVMKWGCDVGEVMKWDICVVDVDLGVEFEDEGEKHKKRWPWLGY